MTTDRSDFNETWVNLLESPTGIKNFPTYETICNLINQFLDLGYNKINLGNNLYKFEIGNLVIYWIQDDADQILLGCELYNRPQGLVVLLTGKNPRLKNQKPYASDLYLSILKDTQKAIRILSDTQLTDEGFNIWKRLYQSGACISVYNKVEKDTGKSFILLKTYNDFLSYFDHGNVSMANFQYVLTLNKSIALAETISFFGLRRLRELSGLDLTDFKEK